MNYWTSVKGTLRKEANLLSERSVLLPTSTMMTSLPLSVLTSSIHLDVCWNDVASNESEKHKTHHLIKLEWQIDPNASCNSSRNVTMTAHRKQRGNLWLSYLLCRIRQWQQRNLECKKELNYEISLGQPCPTAANVSANRNKQIT